MGNLDKQPRCLRCATYVIIVMGIWCFRTSALQGQTSIQKPPKATEVETTSADQTQPPAPRSVSVTPHAPDEEIAQRIQRILQATTWFPTCEVHVDHGVVFLSGTTADIKYKDWATNLSEKTDDVVAVVNRIVITQRSFWDLSPAWDQINDMVRLSIQALPLVIISLVILIITWFLSGWTVFLARNAIARRFPSPILQQIGSRMAVIPVAIIGIYLALRIGGLTQIAATILGGTGLLGLVIGIAFRDITENLLASILISMQRPFELGDQINVGDIRGIVQSVTTRGTVIMTLDGNHVQIPNSLIYKSVISNYTANPQVRLNFTLPISKEIVVEQAQKAVMSAVRQHSAVSSEPEPEPLVLVDELREGGPLLKILFWIDGHQFSADKVRSAVMRLSANALQKLPPAVSATHNDRPELDRSRSRHGAVPEESVAEGGLSNEQHDLEKQAKNCSLPNNGTNLLQELITVPSEP